MKIILDVLGGDNAPKATIEAASLALNKDNDLSLVLVGPEKQIKEKLNEQELSRIEIIDSSEAVLNTDHPATFLQQKPNCTLAIAFDLLHKREDIDALVSAGPTGAILTGAVLKIGRIPGIKRPCLMSTLPTENNGIIRVMDAGANMDPQPEWLLQYAIMGEAYLKTIGIDNPRIGLLSVGQEKGKGNELTKATYSLLESSGMNFVGNIEGDHVLRGEADIVVSDGFSGNVFLKSLEEGAKWVAGLFTKAIKKNIFTKFGALFQLKHLKEVKKPFKYANEACAPMLGVKKIILKAHGKAEAATIAATIIEATRLAKDGLINKIAEKVKIPEGK